MKIELLEIFTPNLKKQTIFYSQVLRMPIVERSDKAVSFQVGRSMLKLIYRKSFSPYHYAINIPANQEQEALTWLRERVSILTYEAKEIQYFDFWDAYAIYFYDEDGNIGELIARRGLNNESKRPFDERALLEISEIGLPTNDIKREYDILNKNVGLPIYSGNMDRFCSIGDGHGLFIVIDKKVKKEWFPTKDKPYSSDFNIRIKKNGKSFYFKYEKEQLRLV